MSSSRTLSIDDLSLDLNNFRTPPQPSEVAALRAMVGADPKAFWGLTESLLDRSYLPTENIIVLDSGGQKIVKEGNRRIAAIKLILGKLKPGKTLEIPDGIATKIAATTPAQKLALSTVPCGVFGPSEADTVDSIIAMTHGKGEVAGRTPWNPVARARHNRDHGGASEIGLDLLESYLKVGQNLSQDNKNQWGGDFPLTVLDEALLKIASRIGTTKALLVADYPGKLSAKHRKSLEAVLHAIGDGTIGFAHLRGMASDRLDELGFQAPPPPAQASLATGPAAGTGGNTSTQPGAAQSTLTQAGKSARGVKPKAKAIDLKDPKSAIQKLRGLPVNGKHREKVVALQAEAVRLDIAKTPHAFCFVLRALFELSAKAYCKDHAASGIKLVDKNGQDRALVDLLRDIVNHMITNALPAEQKQVQKAMHGALTELAQKDRLLSVTSMNQLVHSSHFSVAPKDVCVMFHSIFPLLEAMNA